MYDYVIVGAGSAGCVLANRLSADPDVSVVMLEAGGPDRAKEIHIPAAFGKLMRTSLDWEYETEPQPSLDDRRIYWPRGKTLGGSSSMNAQIYMRGNRLDYETWERLGNKGWGWDDVLPLFRRSEHNTRGASEYHGAAGPLWVSDLRDPNPLSLAIVEAAAEAGIPRNPDFNGPAQDGVGLNQVTQHNGWRASTAVAFLKPVRRRRNLNVIMNAHATRIVLDGDRVVGVAYRKDGREEVVRAEREVLLSGGTINSPQLLLLSGIGPAGELAALGVDVAADLPGVGRNLRDHPAVAVMHRVTEPLSLYRAETIGNLGRLLLRGKGMLTSNVGEGSVFVRTDPGLPAPDLQLHFAPVSFDIRLEDPPGEEAVTIGPTLVAPHSVGWLRLRSTDPTEAPVIQPSYLSDPDGADLKALVAGVELSREILAANAFARYRGDEMHPGTDVRTPAEVEAFVRRRTATLYHPVGTCRMGTDTDAVVDPELRVHGVQGLRVIDASVMPTIPRGNTNAPTIMIAEKAAELIAGHSPM